MIAFGWMLVFLAWHVVWYVTGLDFPSPSDRHGAARVLGHLAQWLVNVMLVVGTLLPLALGMAWGERLPGRLLATLGWTATSLLGGRALASVIDTAARVTGILPDGLTGLTVEQVLGAESPTWWHWVASYTTDALFAIGAVVYGRATRDFQRRTCG